jgi:hypothetical protein
MVVFAFYICLCEGVPFDYAQDRLPEAIPQLLDEAVTGR